MNLKLMKEIRDKSIYDKFTTQGYRQKEIAAYYDLSESRVKAIIGEIKRSKRDSRT